MAKMIYNGEEYEVVGFIQDTNAWEYFMLTLPDENGIFNALVDGHVIEEGPVDINAVNVNIQTRVISTDEDSPHFAMPIRGGQWA
jgi:hypothetical protein